MTTMKHIKTLQMKRSDVVIASLVIKKPIVVDDISIDVNEDLCETKVIKYSDETLCVSYFVYYTKEVVLKERITKNVKQIWQKAQQQQ